MLIAGAGEPGGLQLHSPEETEETVARAKVVVMNAKRTRFRISHSLPRLQKRVVFRERERVGQASVVTKLN